MKCILFSILFVLIIGLNGCKKHTEISISGHNLVLTADPYLPLIQQEVDQYMSLYSGVKMEVRSASTREAIVLLLNDSVRSIVTDRPFNEEERQVVQQVSIRINEYKIAEDGIAIIVHKKNPISNITAESVRNIITGVVNEWSQVVKARGSGSIDFVITGRNSGMYELLQQKFLPILKPLEPTTMLGSQREVIQYVSAHPQAVGFVAASILTGEIENVKILPFIAQSAKENEKEVLPGQQEIYSSLYPFHYSLYLYNAEAKAATGVGFSALVLSHVGQKIIQNAGLVPVSIPYRTIQLHAE